MEVLYPRCCGLDVHQKTVVACLITPEGKEIRTFKTMTSDLLQLADWIVAKGVTHLATGLSHSGSLAQQHFRLTELVQDVDAIATSCCPS